MLLDLPTSTAALKKKPDKQTYVSIKPDLGLAIGETTVKRVDLVRELDALPEPSKGRPIFLRADRGNAPPIIPLLIVNGGASYRFVNPG